MTAKRTDPALARAYEYIDSPRMTQRLVYRKELSARIDGNYGVYRTIVHTGRRTAASCSCPSDVRPCKHAQAVRATWKECPDSFFDLERYLKSLGKRSRAELTDAIAELILAYPGNLAILGVPGFEPGDVEEEDE